MSRIICLDWGYYIHKAIYSKADFSKDLIVLKMLSCDLNYVKVTSEDRVIVAIDNHSHTAWRKKFFPEYKANRVKLDPYKFYHVNKVLTALDMSTKLECINLTCDNEGERYGLEADDIISYVVRYNQDKEVIIISHDTDFEQLYHFNNCKIFSPLSKKFKTVTNPLASLQKKIYNKEWSDNLLEKVTNERDFERKKLVVSLLELPSYVEDSCKNYFESVKEKETNKFYFPLKEIPKIFEQVM